MPPIHSPSSTWLGGGAVSCARTLWYGDRGSFSNAGGSCAKVGQGVAWSRPHLASESVTIRRPWSTFVLLALGSTTLSRSSTSSTSAASSSESAAPDMDRVNRRGDTCADASIPGVPPTCCGSCTHTSTVAPQSSHDHSSGRSIRIARQHCLGCCPTASPKTLAPAVPRTSRIHPKIYM